jgi:hypothetical protein
MTGWKIFVHSVRQVFGNLGPALRVSGLLYLVQIVVQHATIGNLLNATNEEQQAMITAGTYPWVGLLLFIMVATVCGLWIAVGWHRYILTDEKPGLLPAFHGDRMLGYFGTGLLIAVVLLLPAFLLDLLVALFAAPLIGPNGDPVMLSVVAFAVTLPIWMIGLRLNAMLPGVALKPGSAISDGWNATKGQTGAIVLLALISVAATEAVNFVGAAAFGDADNLLFVWQALTGWPILIIGISILTTLYGHYIEGRPLV